MNKAARDRIQALYDQIDRCRAQIRTIERENADDKSTCRNCGRYWGDKDESTSFPGSPCDTGDCEPPDYD